MQTFAVKEVSAAALRALNYSPAVEKIRRAPKGRRSIPLGRLVREFGPAYGTVFTRKDCAPEHGVELLSQTDMFAAEPEGRVIRKDSMARPERHEVQRGQILIAGAGTLGPYELYGRSIIADARLAGKCVGPDSMTLVLADPESDESLYAYAFLATSTGVAAVRSTSYGTKILRFREELLRKLAIPRADDATLKRVANLIRTTVLQRETYLKELQAARKLLEDLPEMQEALAMCSERKARAIAWSGPLPSLHARSFAFAGEAHKRLAKTWQRRLGEVVEDSGLFNGPRFARVTCEPPHGVLFYSQRDPFLIRAVPRRIVVPPVPSRLFTIPRNALLVGSHGQIAEGGIFGRVELATYLNQAAGMSQDVLRMLVRTEDRELAYAFLSTDVGSKLLKSTAIGTSIPSMRIDLLTALPFPALEVNHASSVKRRVIAAEKARIASLEAENEAIRIVEEEVLPSWLA